MCPIELVIMQPKSSYYFFSEPRPITMSRILLMRKSSTERQIRKRIFKMLRSVLILSDFSDPTYKKKLNEENQIEMEYTNLFENRTNPNNYDDDGEHKYYKL